MLRYELDKLEFSQQLKVKSFYLQWFKTSCISNLQKILGKDVDSGIRTFGWSLSGGMDLDGNQYPDVLVGAYESSNAVYIRSAPVVHLDSKVDIVKHY